VKYNDSKLYCGTLLQKSISFYFTDLKSIIAFTKLNEKQLQLISVL